jgi:hypothetical protein
MGKTYRLGGQEAVRPILRRLVLRSVFVFALVMPVSLWLAARVSGGFGRADWMVTVPVTLAITAVVVYQSVSRQRAVLLASEWVLKASSILRRTPYLGEIEIKESDISKVEQSSTALIVRGASRAEAIWIPATLDGFGEVREQLGAWHEIVPWKPMILQWGVAAMASLGFVLAAATTFTSSNPLIVAPLALLVLLGLCWSGWYFRRSPAIDARSKGLAWLAFVPGVAVLVRAYLVLRR